MSKVNLLNLVQMTKPNKNVFDLSHDVKLTGRMGNLIPTLVMDCIPGDKVNLRCESLLRMQALISPMMHRVDVSHHYFFVPNRILWDGWEDFITNTEVGGAVPAHPYFESAVGSVSGLADYMGLPLSAAPYQFNALPFAAYQKIFFDYFADENLTLGEFIPLIDGINDFGDYDVLRRRAWEHDYFTACLPFAQKGAAVDIPLAPFDDVNVKVYPPADFPAGFAQLDNLAAGSDPTVIAGTPSDPSIMVGSMYAETSTLNAQPTTINDLRRAFRLQEWLEKSARGGSRYIENTLAFFGVRSSDKRLQRAEYITGVKTPVIISEVLNTTGTADAPQGNMAGHGVALTSAYGGSYFCEEHGYIICVMSIMPKTAYQQGLPRHYSRRGTFDYYWPQFANIGEQEVKMKEIFIDAADKEQTFGYLPRYTEYKFMPNRVAGNFKNSLDFWHLGRIFETEPNLNQDFIQCNPSDRVFAVQDPEVDNIVCQVMHHIKAVRAMPYYGTPTF